MAGGMCMLIAGELAVRWVAKIEATASAHVTNSNFKFTSRTQVSFAHPCLPCVSVFMARPTPPLVITYRVQHAEHRSFGAEPPSQAWPPTSKSSNGVDDLWYVPNHCSPHSLVPRSDQHVFGLQALASLFPFFITAPRTAEGRLLTYFLSFCPCFVILAIRAEGLFYLSYCTTLYLWTLVEEDARRSKMTNKHSDEYGSGWNPRRLSRDDVRIALFFLFFVQVGFFGTGK